MEGSAPCASVCSDGILASDLIVGISAVGVGCVVLHAGPLPGPSAHPCYSSLTVFSLR